MSLCSCIVTSPCLEEYLNMLKFLLLVMYGFQHCFLSHSFFSVLDILKNLLRCFYTMISLFTFANSKTSSYSQVLHYSAKYLKWPKLEHNAFSGFFSMKQLLINKYLSTLCHRQHLSSTSLSEARRMKTYLACPSRSPWLWVTLHQNQVSKMYISLFLIF